MRSGTSRPPRFSKGPAHVEESRLRAALRRCAPVGPSRLARRARIRSAVSALIEEPGCATTMPATFVGGSALRDYSGRARGRCTSSGRGHRDPSPR